MASAPRTQAERRASSRAAVLESAFRLFGRKGFANTSLEEIASEAGMTIRPIYHYFDSKLGLFAAVNEEMEERIVASLQVDDPGDIDGLAAWRRFLELCEDPEFRRIVLVDAPGVLGRERWATSPVSRTVAGRLRGSSREPPKLSDLAVRMLMGALAEAALAIAESDDADKTSHEAEQLVAALLSAVVLTPEEAGS